MNLPYWEWIKLVAKTSAVSSAREVDEAANWSGACVGLVYIPLNAHYETKNEYRLTRDTR